MLYHAYIYHWHLSCRLNCCSLLEKMWISLSPFTRDHFGIESFSGCQIAHYVLEKT